MRKTILIVLFLSFAFAYIAIAQEKKDSDVPELLKRGSRVTTWEDGDWHESGCKHFLTYQYFVQTGDSYQEIAGKFYSVASEEGCSFLGVDASIMKKSIEGELFELDFENPDYPGTKVYRTIELDERLEYSFCCHYPRSPRTGGHEMWN